MNTNTISLLLDVGRVIRARMQRELPISLSQCETLRLLEQEDGLTMHVIAKHFKIAAPSATSLVNELVRTRLVARAENAKDRREVLLHLTARGKKILYSTEESRKGIVAEVLSILSERDRKQLDVILNKILTGTKSR